MNKEIKLSRAERRRQKKETIRKNTKHIPKEEYLNRADRRALVKNKNLLVEIVKIINKYLPQLSYIIDNLTDKRNKSYIKYNMRTIIFTRLFALICGITTMNGMTRTFNTENTIKNSLLSNSNSTYYKTITRSWFYCIKGNEVTKKGSKFTYQKRSYNL